MQAVEALSLDIVGRHRMRREHVLAHSDVAPWRKRDPGEKFDWARLAGIGLGLWVEPTRIEGDAGFGVGDEGAEIAALQRQLAEYGYRCEPNGLFDEETAFVVTAFQRHFRPALVNGRADHSTIDTLGRLLAARRAMA
jgi:N-acetylmuramoyl-L-alanine amidase